MTDSEVSIDVEKELRNLLDKKAFSPIDVTEITISYCTFTDRGVSRCKNSAKKLSDILYSCLFGCKHPGLNPCIDKIFDYKEEKDDGKDALSKFLLSEANFNSRELDNNNDFLEILVKIDLLVMNLETFLEKEEIKIKKAVIQTALFKKEIG